MPAVPPAPPTVSILLMAYRSQATIIEALDGALAQTVPCEIIVSDDASGDTACEIANAHLRGYQGPHRVSVRSTSRNLGLCAHIAELARIANGEILVFMAGDDVSYPHRVHRILDAFARDTEAYAVGSSYDEVDQNRQLLHKRARVLPEYMDQTYFLTLGKFSTLHGATMAIRREVLDRFPAPEGAVEDNLLSLRAALLGHCAYVQEPLIEYRRHPGNLTKQIFSRTGRDARDAFELRYRRTIELYRQVASDHENCLAMACDLVPAKRRLGEQLVAMYRLEADSREAILDLPKRQWLAPIWAGLKHPGLRRKSLERALKLALPRRLLR